MTRALWLPDLARDAGLTVRLHPGWETRGNAGLTPLGGVAHHTASKNPIDRFLARGRSDLAGPLCQWSTHPDGTIAIIASGVANHAGRYAGSNPLLRFGANRNAEVYGDEMVNRGIDGVWPAVQIDAATAMWAAVCRFHEWGSERIVSHREWAGPRKPDPHGVDMDEFRRSIAAQITTDKGATSMTVTDLKDWIEAQYIVAGRDPAADEKSRAWWLVEISRDMSEQSLANVEQSERAAVMVRLLAEQ